MATRRKRRGKGRRRPSAPAPKRGASQLLISVDESETWVALLEGDVLEEVFIDRPELSGSAGNVYKGKVGSVLPGMQASFIDIGLGKDGFLHVADIAAHMDTIDDVLGDEPDIPRWRPDRGDYPQIQDILRPGQEILVQVVKESIGNKGPRLTSYISLPGRHLVLMPTVDHTGVSRRIADDNERLRLKKIIKQIKPEGMGFIVRTAGEGWGEREFSQDIRYLTGVWQKMQRKARGSPAPVMLYEELPLLYRVVRDYLSPQIEKIVIDSKSEYSRLRRFLKTLQPDSAYEIELHTGDVPLFEKYNLDRQIEAALRSKVWLPSGGYIVIESTEALITIDVNTGRYTGKDNLEDTVYKTNMEAAWEVARQLRLRDIGGIVIIDFIDMEDERNRRDVLRELEMALERDRARTNVFSFSPLGLVEVTRQRSRHSLQKALCQPCPYCQGTGHVRSPATIAIETLRRLGKICREVRERKLIVRAHVDIAARLSGQDARRIRKIERRYRRRIVIEADPEAHLEDVTILSGSNRTPIKGY